MADKPPVRKVRPYPLNCLMEGNGAQLRVSLVQLTDKAFLAKIQKEMLHVGDYYVVEFDIPVYRHTVKAKVRVVKTYDRATDMAKKVVDRFAEFHFDNLTDMDRKAIVAFLKAIGQK